VDELVHAGVKARGGTYDAAHHFAAFCRRAGLRLLGQRGFLPAAEPLALLETFQAVLRALGSGMITQGITSQGEMDDLLGELEAAKGAEYMSSFANLYIEMIAEVTDYHAAAQQHG
jgi:hypothetical protein